MRRAVLMVPAWIVLTGVTFMWPTELEKVMDRVRDNPMPVNFQDIQILKQAGTREAVDMLFELMDHSDEATSLNAARAIVDLERARWKAPEGEGGRRLQDTLVDWLDLPDADMRRAACELLALTGATAQRDRVAMMVTDADLDVRASCVRSLLSLYVGADDLDPVKPLAVQILSDPYHEVRINAIQGLGWLGVKETFMSFLPLLESDNPSMRSRALDAVTVIDPEQAHSFAVKAIGDSDLEVRIAAVRALGKIGNPAAVEALEPLLEDHVLGRYVIEALGNIEDASAFELLLGLLEVPVSRDAALGALVYHKAPAADAVAEAMMATWDTDVLRMLVRVTFFHPSPKYLPAFERILGMAPQLDSNVLGALHGIHEPGALKMALALVADPTPKIQKLAIEISGVILEEIGPDPAAEEVLADALCYEDHEVRMEALRLVRRWKIEQAAVLLVPLLESRYEDESVAAAAALLELGETVGLPIVVEALVSSSRDVRREAATVLAKQKPAQVLEPLIALLEKEIEKDADTPGAAVRFDLLGLLMRDAPSPEARTLVSALLDDDDARVRVLAAGAATVSDLPAFRPALAEVLGSKRAKLRRAVAPRLWHVAGEDAPGMLDMALGDPDPMVRALAVLSLEMTAVFGAQEKLGRLMDGLRDEDEFVRINAAAGLGRLGVPLADHVDELCAAYDRPLTNMESLAAMMLLARAGAPCLQEPVERLLFNPSTPGMAAALLAVRTGVQTGGIKLSGPLRMGLGMCSVGNYYLFSDTCDALLEGGEPPGESCPKWYTLTATNKTTGLEPWARPPGPEEVLPGEFHARMTTNLASGHPVFVVDGAGTVRVSIIDDELVGSLDQPECGHYSAAGVLRF